MIQLVALLLFGILVLVVGLYALRRPPPATTENDASADDLKELIALRGLDFRNVAGLFADSDYQMLLADPRLLRIALELRQDRKRIALHWLRALQQDVFSLWQLRRLLAKYGAVQSTAEELATILHALGIVSLILLLRLLVFLFGPFRFARGVSEVRGHAHSFSSSCARAVRRLPSGRWIEFINEWRGTHEAPG